MPTPVGHALGGLATVWFSDAISRKRSATGVMIAGVAAATAADIDILFSSHRTYTHSIGAALLAGAFAWLVVRFRPSAAVRPTNVVLTITAAYGSHVLLDWLGKDTAPPFGLTALWPFSSRFYVSGADLFMEISRRYWKLDEFIVGNIVAVGWEVLLLGPIVVLAWWLRRTLVVDRG